MLRASPDHVFSHIARPEHFPRYAGPLWLTADPGERRGAEQTVSLQGYFAGLPVDAVVRVTVRSPRSVEFVQVYGTLRVFRGTLTVRATEDGAELTYRVEADPGIPLLSEEACRQFLVQHVEGVLDRVKLAAERKSPSRPRRARGEPEPAEAGEGPAAEASGEEEQDARPAAPPEAPRGEERPTGGAASLVPRGRAGRRRRRRRRKPPGSPP